MFKGIAGASSRKTEIMLFTALCCTLLMILAILADAHPTGSPYRSSTEQGTVATPSIHLSGRDPKGSERRDMVARSAAEPREVSQSLVGDRSPTADMQLTSRAIIVNLSTPITSPSRYPSHCFDKYSTKLASAKAEDCEVIISHIILTYPNPMQPQTFGYNDDVDIDLREVANRKWYHGNCVIFVSNRDKTTVDTFRMVDVAEIANRLTKECVQETKYGFGGTSNVGRMASFYVAVGGMVIPGATSEE